MVKYEHIGVDETAYETKRKKLDKRPKEARCLSYSCNKKNYGYVVKTTNSSRAFCPDCGHALFWAIKGSKSGW